MTAPRHADIERIAAEEIAADQARTGAHDRLKLGPGVSGPVEPGAAVLRPGWNSLLRTLLGSRRGLFGIVTTVVLVVALLAALGILGRPGTGPSTAGGSPTPTSTASLPATGTPTTEPPTTEPPTDAPPGTTGPPGGSTVSQTDAAGDATTDLGEPVPDDQVVDIVAVSVAVLPDGALTAIVQHAAPLPEDLDPGLSRADNLVISAAPTSASAPGGVTLAGQPAQPPIIPLAIYFWQFHEGVITMGRADGATGRPLDTAAIIQHRVSAGQFAFMIPAAEVPPDAHSVWVLSFHRPTATDVRRLDQAGPIVLPGG